MHILIIDDFPDFSRMLERLIAESYPGASTTIYDPNASGRPTPSFPWGQYDVLFLDYQLGQYNGLDWLKEFRGDPNFPVTIFLTGQGNETVAVKALKLGAEDYIRKDDLTPKLVRTSILQAIRAKGHPPKIVPEEFWSEKPADTPTTQAINSKCPLPFTDQDIASGNNRIGSYRIQALIEEGGMSMVYLAKMDSTGQEVAIKFLDPSLIDSGNYLDRFIQEYQLLVDMHHPNLIRIHEQRFTDCQTYIVMEYLPGGNLNSLIKEGALSIPQTITYIHDIATALTILHENGIIHRDLKPANILFRANGNPVLSDFGMAKLLDDDLALTRHGELVGTPLYVNPEQVQNQPVDERSDLYSLGVMFYEMIAGRRPFKASSAPAIMYKHAYEDPKVIPGISDSLNAVIQKLLAKKPEHRYPSAQALQAALSNLII